MSCNFSPTLYGAFMANKIIFLSWLNWFQIVNSFWLTWSTKSDLLFQNNNDSLIAGMWYNTGLQCWEFIKPVPVKYVLEWSNGPRKEHCLKVTELGPVSYKTICWHLRLHVKCRRFSVGGKFAISRTRFSHLLVLSSNKFHNIFYSIFWQFIRRTKIISFVFLC